MVMAISDVLFTLFPVCFDVVFTEEFMHFSWVEPGKFASFVSDDNLLSREWNVGARVLVPFGPVTLGCFVHLYIEYRPAVQASMILLDALEHVLW